MCGFRSKRGGKKIFSPLFKFTCLVVLCLEYSLNTFSQNANLFDNKFQFGFSLNSTIIPEPQVTREFGKAELLTRKTFGFEAALTLKYILNRNININTGIFYGKLPYSWGFDFKEGEFSSLNGNQYSDKGSVYDINYWYFPFNLETMLWSTGKTKYYLLTGINIRHYLDGQTSQGYQYGYLNSTKSNQDFFLVVLDVNFPYQVRLNYQLGASTYIKMKNLNDFKVGLLYNVSFAKIVNGYYGFFQDTNEYTFGSYSMTGSYWALTFGYVLTGERKLKREYEY